MLYNALDVPQVYADKDGQTLEKKGEYNSATKDYDKITMMSILNKDGIEHEELTQKDIAKRLGISQSYISRLEKRIIHKLKLQMKQQNY